jgi:hypothetical protein
LKTEVTKQTEEEKIPNFDIYTKSPESPSKKKRLYELKSEAEKAASMGGGSVKCAFSDYDALDKKRESMHGTMSMAMADA